MMKPAQVNPIGTRGLNDMALAVWLVLVMQAVGAQRLPLQAN